MSHEDIGFIMNKRTFLRILAAVFVCPVGPAQPKDSSGKLAPPAGLEERLKRFFAEMRRQAVALAKQTNEPIAREIQAFLEAGEKGDWKTVAANYWDSTVVGQTVRECYGAYEQFVQGEEKYVTLFAQEILDSMPRGSIYFGGNASALDLPTAFSQSHVKADPCFILSQNALADNLYLQYLQVMYGDRLKLPSTKDLPV